MAIIDRIDSSKQGFARSNSSEDLTLAEAREQFKQEAASKLHDQQLKYIKEQVEFEAKLEKQNIKKNTNEYKKLMSDFNKRQSSERIAEKNRELAEEYKLRQKYEKELAESRTELNKAIIQSSDTSFKDKAKAWGDELKNQLTGVNLADTVAKSLEKTLGNFISGIESVMDKYASYQASINARLQGSGRTFRTAENLMTTAIGIQPYVKNQAMVENLANLVDSGIAYNVELRAFIETVSENIATTFDATNGTLLRLVRLQQQDSTASRLGLEASLTRYFNSMYQNTEYLSNAFDAVSQSLVEASSTMTSSQSIEFEYQVQKWLGSLYSVGMSDSTIQGLAQALGYLGSGNVSALSNSQFQNLLVMSASRAGLNYGDLLTGGLDAQTTNILLGSMTSYLKEIAQGTNQVVKSELAQTFGVTMSDLTSAVNLNTAELENISKQYMSEASSMSELMDQLTALPGRMSISTMMSNLWDNLLWSSGSSIASNPMMYAMYKVTDMIQNATGGINIPSIFAFGSGIDLNTTVENLVKLGVVGASSLGLIGDLVSGISSTASPLLMLSKITAGSALQNIMALGGSGLSAMSEGISTASTTYIGQSSGGDIAQQARQGAVEEATAVDASDSDKKDMQELTELIQSDVSRIVELLSVDGIRIANYGLTNNGGL